MCENVYRYLLESTGDKSDRTRDIEIMLQESGVCHLGAGVFYVRGVEMPDDTTLMGMGAASRLILMEDIDEGFTVKMASRCLIKDLLIEGSDTHIPHPDTLGGRHGILFAGTVTVDNWKSTPSHPLNSIIDCCQIRYFSGGGITCKHTGYNNSASLTVTNCHIVFTGACIYIPRFSEYHEFTNVLCSESLYGCINNGGNNTFVNCGFTSNKTGFVIDNSDGLANNNSHGNVVGCMFNHSDSNKGIGIHLIGANCGYMFTGCQMFYSKLILENSDLINFSNFNFGRNAEIEVKGGTLTLFTNCAFFTQPKITVADNERVKFTNCFTLTGEPVTP